jgi:uncharacterized SAM-binding protein YcdF (DUF218 family)
MFMLSKIVWLIAQPLSLAFLLAVLAALFGFLRWHRLAALAALSDALLLFVILYTTAGTVGLQALENRIPKPASDPANISCMIVLGGAFENEVTSVRGGVEFNQAADRFVEALRLALRFPQSRVLVSGGDGSFSGTYEGEAAASKRFFAEFGIGPERMIEENHSRTTYENTVNTAALLKADGLTDCLLITSGFHMPRALALFEKAGIAVTPWPVDYRTNGQTALRFDFTQPALNAQQTATAVREWLGLAFYRMTGRITRIP